MPKREGMEVSIAASEAIRLANVDAIAAYPITPQTHIVEHLSEFVANGELDAEFIPVESEHSAMSVCMGTSAAGARTFTCTSSQGLALMSEIVFITPPMQLPIVMILANRSLSGPLSIWNDHTDVMMVRDCGWIQAFGENGQEIFDLTLTAFRIAEDRRVLLPFMLNMDGFILSHVIEPIEMMDQETVDKFLPVYKPKYRMDPDNPVTMGAFAMPDLYTETKKAQDEKLKASLPVIEEAWKEFGDLTGRYYHPIETYKAEGAKTLFVTMGSFGETAATAVDMLKEKGEDVGLCQIRLWRPFPYEAFWKAVEGVETLIIVDRATSYGGPGGPVASEIRSALYTLDPKPRVVDFIAGLAGRDVAPVNYEDMYTRAKARIASGDIAGYEIYGARE